MKFKQLLHLIYEELTADQKYLVDQYTAKRSKNLTFGPLFSKERTFFPLEKSSLDVIEVPKNILSILDQTEYYCPDYRAGYCYKKDDKLKNKPVKLIKILNKEISDDETFNKLKKQYDERLSTSRKDFVKCILCITYNPYDVAAMSTDRNWTSCMDLVDGIYKSTPLYQVQYGGMCAYLIKEGDAEISNPIARIAIKRFVIPKTSYFIFLPEPRIYGDERFAEELGFMEEVKNILLRSNQMTADLNSGLKRYERNDNRSYSDSEISSLYYIQGSEDDVLMKIKDDLELFKSPIFYKSIFRQNFSIDFFKKLYQIIIDNNIKKFFDVDIFAHFCCVFLRKQSLSSNDLEFMFNIIDDYLKRPSTYSSQFFSRIMYFMKFSNLTETFIEFLHQYQKFVPWDYFSAIFKSKFSDEFIEEFKDTISWSWVLDEPRSEEFLRKYVKFYKDPHWRIISQKQDLSKEFIDDFSDKLNLYI